MTETSNTHSQPETSPDGEVTAPAQGMAALAIALNNLPEDNPGFRRTNQEIVDDFGTTLEVRELATGRADVLEELTSGSQTAVGIKVRGGDKSALIMIGKTPQRLDPTKGGTESPTAMAGNGRSPHDYLMITHTDGGEPLSSYMSAEQLTGLRLGVGDRLTAMLNVSSTSHELMQVDVEKVITRE